jgi:UDP-N-acetylglucosamine 2-epimerase (non-hydrolysing)
MLEVLTEQMPKVKRNATKVLKAMGVAKGKYFVVSAHREENIADERHFLNLVECLNEIAKAYKLPIIVSTHPRTRKMIEKKGVKFDKLVKLMKPMGLTEYLALQLNAKAVLSDSGTISEESSILGFKALNLREAHERPEAMEEAAVMMVGQNKERILQALKHLDVAKPCRKVYDYSMPDVSEKVVRIIISYTDYVKRRVWGE